MKKFVWTIAAFVVAVGLVAGCGGGDKDKEKGKGGSTEKTDKDKIVGTWIMTDMEIAGKSFPADKDKEMKIVITPDKFTFAGKDEEATYTLDPSKKHIDTTDTKGKDKGMVKKGLYSLDGDTLKMAFSMSDKKDAPRPTELKTAEKSDVGVMTFKREKAK